MNNSPKENVIPITRTTVNACYGLVISEYSDYLEQATYIFGTIIMSHIFVHLRQFFSLFEIWAVHTQ